MDCNYCVICQGSLSDGQPIVILHQKGSKSINQASEYRGDDIETTPGQSVHTDCRQKYCNKHLISKYLREKANPRASSVPNCQLRSQGTKFSFQEHCLFCSQPVVCPGKKRSYDDTAVLHFPVRTGDFKATVETVCKMRNDTWAQQVQGRIEYAQDLYASDAVYHQVCSINFRTGKQIPVQYQFGGGGDCKSELKGRPVDSMRESAFLKVAAYLEENDDEQVTVSDLVLKMKDCCQDPYSVKYMKLKLEKHFRDKVLITNVQGKADVVTFKTTAAGILDKFYQTPIETDPEVEKLKIIKTASKLIKNDIKMSVPQCRPDVYPTPEDISDMKHNLGFVPMSLRVLLRNIFTERNADLKIASVGQAIVQAAMPRLVLAPLQIGLAVQMHHHFGSRFLVDSLNSHGFCTSYTEVKKFEMSAASSQATDLPGINPGHFVQFVADNVDHNVRTLDGFNTFHGMGIIATITPGTKHQILVPRQDVIARDLAVKGKIKIHFFKDSRSTTFPLIFEEQDLVESPDHTQKLDLLWKISWPLRSPRPAWSGMMQSVCQGEYPGQSSIIFLPMIDMSSSDLSCIYSTLIFVCAEAKRHEVTPVITFDQPLWWKAQTILASEPPESELHSLVIRLGGFHAAMSFLGCIGHVMSGSGLQELLEVVYSPNTVTHMLNGKAMARAVRGHLLVDSALNAMLVAKTFNIPLTKPNNTSYPNDELDEVQAAEVVASVSSGSEESPTLGEDLAAAVQLYDKLLTGEVTVQEVCLSRCLDDIQKKLETQMSQLTVKRTSKLWLQYMQMVDILRLFIKAERTGDWMLHLRSLQEMLPFFAASGHNLYAKSAYIYIQQMVQLADKHPDVFTFFMSGHHVIRRSDRYWAGLSSDLVIEQTLMRTMKTTGGLTRGRGMAELQRMQWLLSMPACSSVNAAMQTLTEADFVTSDQHKDVTTARQARDDKDARSLLDYLQHRDPFERDTSLQNIATGVTANSTVNVDQAREVGCKILQSMTGQNVSDFTFKKKDTVVIMDNKSHTKVDGHSLPVDPQLLFQRLLTVARETSENLSDIFRYELCNQPPALFDTSGLPRQANKPALADAIWIVGKGDDMHGAPPLAQDMQYVLDGGSLLYRLPWSRGATFGSICHMYVDYVKKFLHPTIVFDGYIAGPSTKDITHTRRLGGIVGAKVNFNASTPFTTKKEQFLTNASNKQAFISLLSQKLVSAGCHVLQADGDADVLIAKTAVACAAEHSTTIIGEDTDLLILLIFSADAKSKALYLQSDKKKGKKFRVWDIHWFQRSLGPEMCSLLPFIHAIAGCDTTSHLFGIGKGVPLRKLKSDLLFREQAYVFSSFATKDEVHKAGEKAIACLYGGQPNESLDKLRHRKFCEKVSTSTSPVQVHTLPPTAAAARYHSMRVYYQVQEWIGQAELDPQQWGWDLVDGKLNPTTTDLPPAPQELLKIVHCNCRSDCSSQRCTCRKMGLECSVACGECRGTSCSNCSPVYLDEENDFD